MTRSVYSKRYQSLRQILKRIRKEAKLPQKKLSAMLDMPHSFVCKYEQGERRLDIVELMDIADILEIDIHEIISELQKIK